MGVASCRGGAEGCGEGVRVELVGDGEGVGEGGWGWVARETLSSR